jgi:hypothetical protein
VMYAGVILVLGHTIRHWGQLRRVAMVIVVSGFLMALIGLLHKFSGSREIFWFRAPRYGGDIFGPFSNRNHFAAHMNMVFGVALGLFLSSRYVRDMMGWPTWRDRLAWLSSRRASRMVLASFTIVLVTGAVCASMSRGAILSLCLAVILLAVILLVRRKGEEYRSGMVLVLAMVIVAVLWMGGEPLWRRIGSLGAVAVNPLEDYRLMVTRDTVRLFMSYPITGCGFGCFSHVFSAFQSPGLEFRWLHAHNDWMQVFAEGGAVGAGIVLVGLVGWLRYLRIRAAKAPLHIQLMVLGLLTGLATVAIHSAVDYGLRKPANALLFSAMIGLTVAGMNIGDAGVSAEARAAARGPRRRSGLRRLVLLLALAGTATMMVAFWKDLRGELAFARFLYFGKMADKARTPAETATAIAAACSEAEQVLADARRNPDALTEVTAAYQKWSLNEALDRDFRTRLVEASVGCAGLAVAAAPTDYLAWLELARACAMLGFWDEAEVCLTHARQLVRHGSQVRMFRSPTPLKRR